MMGKQHIQPTLPPELLNDNRMLKAHFFLETGIVKLMPLMADKRQMKISRVLSFSS